MAMCSWNLRIQKSNYIKNLETLYDPSGDIGLITRWLDVLWRGAMAHCPCCHSSFPLAEVENKRLEEWRQENEEPSCVPIYDTYERRLEILKRAENRKKPHPGQVKALSAPERHIVGTGAARAG